MLRTSENFRTSEKNRDGLGPVDEVSPIGWSSPRFASGRSRIIVPPCWGAPAATLSISQLRRHRLLAGSPPSSIPTREVHRRYAAAPAHSRLHPGGPCASPHRPTPSCPLWHLVALTGLLRSRVNDDDLLLVGVPSPSLCHPRNTVSAAAALALGLRVDPRSTVPSSSLAKAAKPSTRFREWFLAVIAARRLCRLSGGAGGGRRPTNSFHSRSNGRSRWEASPSPCLWLPLRAVGAHDSCFMSSDSIGPSINSANTTWFLLVFLFAISVLHFIS
jgi:hypothetical protein